MNAQNGLGNVPGSVKAMVTQTQAKLVFTLGTETAMALETSGVFRALKLFSNLNFGMDFQADHFYPRSRRGANSMPDFSAWMY